MECICTGSKIVRNSSVLVDYRCVCVYVYVSIKIFRKYKTWKCCMYIHTDIYKSEYKCEHIHLHKIVRMSIDRCGIRGAVLQVFH